MKAMILAAGRGERMRPLTDNTPKPLLQVKDFSLIEHHIHSLKKAGIDEIIINTGWLAEKIHHKLGKGRHFGVQIIYSDEGYPALETAGGIVNALPLLGEDPFLVVNGDIFCQFDFSTLVIEPKNLAHLVLVPNPSQHSKGDYSLLGRRVCIIETEISYTFSGIAVYKPAFFSGISDQRMPLRPVFDKAVNAGYVSGQIHHAVWYDIGTT